MKLTAKQLKKIITEEFESVMKEQGAELYRAFNSATMNMLKAGHSARQLVDMVKSHARGRMIQNMSDEERIAMWNKMGIQQEEISEAHDGVHVEGAVDEAIAVAAQTALRHIEDNAPEGTIPHEQIPLFIEQLSDALRSIIEELQDLDAELTGQAADHGHGWPGASPKYRG